MDKVLWKSSKRPFVPTRRKPSDKARFEHQSSYRSCTHGITQTCKLPDNWADTYHNSGQVSLNSSTGYAYGEWKTGMVGVWNDLDNFGKVLRQVEGSIQLLSEVEGSIYAKVKLARSIVVGKRSGEIVKAETGSMLKIRLR